MDMSASSYNRGSAKISRDIDTELNNPATQKRLDHSAEVHNLTEALTKATARKIELMGELETAKADRFKAQQDAERLEKLLAQADKRAGYWEDQAGRNARLLPAITAKWQKLSQIIRWAVNPELYREFSEDFDRMYPNHAAATDEFIEQGDWRPSPSDLFGVKP